MAIGGGAWGFFFSTCLFFFSLDHFFWSVFCHRAFEVESYHLPEFFRIFFPEFSYHLTKLRVIPKNDTFYFGQRNPKRSWPLPSAAGLVGFFERTDRLHPAHVSELTSFGLVVPMVWDPC